MEYDITYLPMCKQCHFIGRAYYCKDHILLTIECCACSVVQVNKYELCDCIKRLEHRISCLEINQGLQHAEEEECRVVTDDSSGSEDSSCSPRPPC